MLLCSRTRQTFVGMKRTFSSIVPFEKFEYSGANKQPSLLLQNNHLDTSIWSDIEIVQSDIFLVSPAKAGSTWMYEIIAQLLYQNKDHGHKSLVELLISPTFSGFRFGGPTKDAKIAELARINDQLFNDNIEHRVFKLHEPVESMPFNDKCKYIFVGRDFRDIIWSFYRHFENYAPTIYQQLNAERDNFKLIHKFPSFEALNKNNDFDEYKFWKMSIGIGDEFGNPDGYPFWSQLWVIGSWLNIAQKYKNIKVIHYNEMKDNLPKIMREIAEFLNIEIDENNFDKLVENCLFHQMKARQERVFGEFGKLWWKKPEQFFYRGINNRWTNVLSQSDRENYRNLAKRYLNEQQIHWLEKGQWV